MKKLLLIALTMTMLVSCTTTQVEEEKEVVEDSVKNEESILEVESYEYETTAHTYESVRGTTIYANVTMPVTDEDVPAIVFTHGHGGFKEELEILTNTIAKNGIAVIIFDHPGCGESTEDFILDNNMENILADMNSTKEYLLTLDGINKDLIAVGGYSMGGRAATLSAANDDFYKAVVLWSPAVANNAEDMYSFTQTDETSFKALADNAHENGQVTYTAIYGFDQTLSSKWFSDMEKYNPIDVASQITAPIFIVRPTNDEIISLDAITTFVEATVNSSAVELVELEGGNHGFGIYSDELEFTEHAANLTASYLKTTLK